MSPFRCRARAITRTLLACTVVLASVARPAQSQDRDVVETAVAAGSFKTLTAALAAAGLVETLQGPGPFTVFAPTDAAFAKLPPGALDALLKAPARLKEILLYHVVAGKLMAADVAKLDGKGAKTIQGADVRVVMMGRTVMLNTAAHVVQADVAARNGVLHAIDAVLVPPASPPAR